LPSTATAPCSRGQIASRGFVYVKENEPLLEELRSRRHRARRARPDVPFDRELLSATVRTAVRQFVNQRFRRRPVVLPIILEV
jgi:ribonuclease J